MDWIATAFLLFGTWRLTKKSKWGWLFNATGSIMMCYVFWPRIPLIILNVTFCVQALYGFVKWYRTEREIVK